MGVQFKDRYEVRDNFDLNDAADNDDYMDFFSWRNIHNPVVGATLKPAKGLKVRLDYHWFWLVEEKDAWFNAGGGVIRQDKTGQSGSEWARSWTCF